MTVIECSCKTCATNAAALGLTLPLRATFESKSERTAQIPSTARGRHSLVYYAHDPSAAGPRTRAILGLTALTDCKHAEIECSVYGAPFTGRVVRCKSCGVVLEDTGRELTIADVI